MGISREQDAVIKQLYLEMFDQLFLYAMREVKNRQFAEEAVQDTFRIACMKPDSLMASENKKGWIMNTMKNVLRNMRKSQSKLNNLVIATMPIEEIEIASSNNDMDFELIYSDLLGNEDFELIKMVVLKKYTRGEAAKELGISVEACKKRVQRAIKKLKNNLEI